MKSTLMKRCYLVFTARADVNINETSIQRFGTRNDGWVRPFHLIPANVGRYLVHTFFFISNSIFKLSLQLLSTFSRITEKSMVPLYKYMCLNDFLD